MDRYLVRLYASAYRDLEHIYTYLAEQLSEPLTAANLIDELESTILSLETLPERGATRHIGVYANQGYRQLFHKNYTIVYRVLKEEKEVHIIAVKYSPSVF